GRTDGYFDETTEDTVSDFQDDEGLDVTGEINEETADRLQELIIEAVQNKKNDRQLKKALELLTKE
ncbi:hypothetical protein AOA57_24210, partial [Pseudomonas sp. 2588-5]